MSASGRPRSVVPAPRSALAKRLLRETRVRERAPLGTLRGQVVRPSTRARYDAALRQFFTWARATEQAAASTALEVDELLGRWAEALWMEGDSRSILANALSGLTLNVPSMAGQLKGSWRLYATWGKREPAKQAPPLS